MNEQQNKGFSYSYSAKEQSEIQRIRKKYEAKSVTDEESKLERLRRLDEGVTRKGSVIALVLGVLGALLMGFGMSLIMVEDFGAHFGGELTVFFVGLALGLVGMVGVALAYPVYNLVVKRERARIAPEILRLSDELMK